ncbi:MAG: trypsin-like peptidase domain-containing protein [Planctomycetota bacterium]|nr:trypsin-like peptidase domain-containing protein [Planctomycetota bacterium]
MRTTLACMLSFAAPLAAQSQDFGKAYSFEERKPVSRVEQVVDRFLPSLVKVHGASGLATISAYATGIIVSKQGHILTLDQIMIQKDRTRVVLYDGSVHQAELLPEDPQLGVRLLRIDPKLVNGELQPLWPSDEEQARFRTGQFVVSLGNAFRLAEFSEKMSATFGVVVGRANTALRYRMSDVKYDGDLILTDACNNQGHYGGGLFTLDGRWIGLNIRLLDSKETNTMLSAAIPVRDLLPYLEEHVLGKQPAAAKAAKEPPWLGAVLFQQAGRTSPPAYVDRVIAGSPAATLGLRPDDLIVRIDEYSIRSCLEFRQILAKYGAGEQVKVTWKRGTQVMQGDLVLASEPKK